MENEFKYVGTYKEENGNDKVYFNQQCQMKSNGNTLSCIDYPKDMENGTYWFGHSSVRFVNDGGQVYIDERLYNKKD